MNLFNKKLVTNRISQYSFPKPEILVEKIKKIEGWQKSLKDSDLSKTKEKTVQGMFLQKFFEEILNYDQDGKGQEEYTLIQHPKTEADATEADGALGFFSKSSKIHKVVIELKDAQTPLDKKQSSRKENYTPIEQAWLYSSKYRECDWIIVSNFREIRLYSKHRSQMEFEKFDVLALHEEKEFKRFYYLLSKDNLISKQGDSVISKLARETSLQEEEISKKFYSDFKTQRQKLFEHLVLHNPEFDKVLLLEKTQKLLDRLIFTLFCEDTSYLLPSNIVKQTYERGSNSFTDSDERIWQEFRGLFRAIDVGNDRVTPPINAYNGGLFAKDDVLDNLKIKDDIWKELIKLSGYDYESDLNVNILGHIFEQSLSDIEQLKAEIEGIDIDKKKSKRKKDGIFYTPEYITRYIVEQTIGKYLDENPDKLEIIKVLDPACGSGAFLNQAYDYLLKRHEIKFEEEQAKKKVKKGEVGFLSLFDGVDNSILLNNLFGVDLNQESVEITKLALWLKTARKDKKLQNLDENIKCGNSLIDDPEVAGEKAFRWQDQYKSLFPRITVDTNILIDFADNTRENHPHAVKLFENSDRILFFTVEKCVSEVQDEGQLKQVFEELIKKGKLFILPNPSIGTPIPTPVPFPLGGYLESTLLAQQKYFARKQNIHKANVEWFKDVGIADSHKRFKIDFLLTRNFKDFKDHEDINLIDYGEAFEVTNDAGFDVVIGNPPYGAILSEKEKFKIKDTFTTVEYQFDTYVAFIEKAISLLKDSGILGFIVPSTWLSMHYFSKMRQLLLNNGLVLVDLLKYQVFDNVTVETSILVCRKNLVLSDIQARKINLFADFEIKKSNIVKYDTWNEGSESGLNIDYTEKETSLIHKIEKDCVKISDTTYTTIGIKPYQVGKGKPKQTREIVRQRIYDSYEKTDSEFRNYITGSNINRYFIKESQSWIKYGEWLAEPRQSLDYEKKRIVIRQTSDRIVAAIDEKKRLNLNNVHNLIIKNLDVLDYESLVCILNSNLINFFYLFLVPEKGRTFAEVKGVNLKKLPVKIPSKESSKVFSILYNEIISKIGNYENSKESITSFLSSNYNLEKLSKKFKFIENIGWNDFIKLIEKKGKQNLNLKQKEELHIWFKSKQLECLTLKSEIDRLDKEIDQVVYKLYGLTDEEIRIVEGEK